MGKKGCAFVRDRHIIEESRSQVVVAESADGRDDRGRRPRQQ